MPSTTTNSKDNAGHTHGALRDLLINYNQLLKDVETLRLSLTGDMMVIPTIFSVGSTPANLATTACTFTINGIITAKAAVAAGTAIPAGTLPADKWALIVCDLVAAGTVTFVGAAANYTTGYATEALAIAAMPLRTPNKARVGYVTIKTIAATAFVAATDSLAGVGLTLNLYPSVGMGSVGPDVNGIQIPPTIAAQAAGAGLNISTYTYNILGSVMPAKAAVTNQAFGALGVVPINKWALVAINIDSAGTVTFSSASANYTSGYTTEALAIADMPATVTAKARTGYVTLKTGVGVTFTFATDGLLGGTGGTLASATNFYPAAGLTLPAGLVAAAIGNQSNPPVAFTT